MRPLDEYKVPTRGTMIGNSLIAPTDFLLSALRKKSLFTKNEIHFLKRDFSMDRFQSWLGTYSFYDTFGVERDGKLSLVGTGYRNALLRILPEGDWFIENENFRDGVWVLGESLERWFIEELPFSSAVMKVIDVVVDCATDDTELFCQLITEQIEEIGNMIEKEWLSDRSILQVTAEWEWNIWLFPKDFFDDGGGDGKFDELFGKMRELVWSILPWWQEVPV